VIWGCAYALRITPSVGRNMLQWDYNKTKVLLTVRKAPFWDSGFVESSMPPLTLKDGNLLFFYDSIGEWNGTTGFQPGWAVLSGARGKRLFEPFYAKTINSSGQARDKHRKIEGKGGFYRQGSVCRARPGLGAPAAVHTTVGSWGATDLALQ
jgi:hypothetical protein